MASTQLPLLPPSSTNRTILHRWLSVSLLLLLLTGNAWSVAWAQTPQLRGLVLDENEQPLPGVSILIKNTQRGTAADAEGRFTLAAEPGNVLVLSLVGYERKEVTVSSATAELRVQLTPSDSQLSEVVVVGYGTQRRSDLTGSVVSLDSRALKEIPAANVLQALAGRAAGVDLARTGTAPGAGAQLRIRGNRSLSGSNDALIVVDGVPYGGNLNDLNTDDIATMDILKDASATAIYGSRGSNGVLIITTKRGRVGKPVISYNAYAGQNTILGQYDMLNGSEFKAMRDLAQYSAGYSPDETAGIAAGTSTNWQDLLYKKGFVTSNELSVSGGTENTQYGVSGGYFKETGVITGQSFERFSLRTSIDTKIGNRVKVGLTNLSNLNYTKGEGINPIYNTLRLSPLTSPVNDDGTPNLRPLRGTVDELSSMNPVTLNDANAIVQRRRRITTFNSLYGEVQIIDGLKYRLNVGLDFRQENFGQYIGPNTIINPGSTLPTQNSAAVQNGESYRYTVDNIVTYDKMLAEKHHLTFTGLYGVQQDRGFTNRVEATGLPADYIQYYNLNLASGTPVVPAGGNNSFSRSGLVSMMARVNYVFSDRYLLTATFRRDGSSVFPGGTWLNYPAFAVGWNISNEEFMKSATWVSNLKLRAGYGITGNQGIPAGATRGSLSTNRYNFGTVNALGYFVSSLGNGQLQWESTSNVNVGVDFGLFGNRVSGSIDLYQQTTDKLLVQKNLPLSNGANSYWTNAAKTQGKGIEVALNTVNVNTSSGFKWTTDLNFAINREKILALEDPSKTQDIGNGWFVGQPINVIYDYNKIGIWQTNETDVAAGFNALPGQIKLQDLNGDGAITDADRSIVGSFQPKWIGGMTNRFSYKNWDLTASINARIGNTLVATYYQSDGTGTGYAFLNNGRVNQPRFDYWTPANPTNAFPQPAPGDRINYSSTLGYYDGSFIRMQSINLGYTLPGNVLKKAGFASARIYLSSRNPFLIYSPFVRDGLGIDPEGTGVGGAVPTQGAAAGTGVNNNRAITVGLTTPPTRQLLVGINLRF
ncbi:SusC/RagA family TonB-linked outer membrane protein [Spirosoma utsteinense]|uniref:TonB-linked SusC/RagA family outer membrane protein n=1 Tax=Spirosoma utsteinense TaxID=2585773 RepID=A0ABR6WDE7_9BACT|nr:TonB-dependent receptor [Spirosoma utsteinense]MBC3787436.1 TonB-linked SusC/RagA family outer membrane protein [Spirosoma utsteinense]MBC3794544.1 TonB-linked SusC/RagA family outer membrane protein [Spirosoma utsteinense]